MRRTKKITRNWLKTPILFLACILVTDYSISETRLYGGTGQNPTFLGCFGELCDSNHPSSICNVKGRYGSQGADLSIWNADSFYGNEYRKTSIWNKGSAGLVMTDGSRMFLGRLTVKQFSPTNNISEILGNFYSESNKDLLKTRLKFCNSVMSQ